MADGELALDLEPDDKKDDKKEEGQEPVIDPMQERQRKADAIERQPEFVFLERGEGLSEAAVGHCDGDDCRQEQEDARRRSPAGEIERRRAHPVAKRAQHRISKRALVPGPS